jgi:NAD(P)-dependent dehydrogenase (short-subunit alcohol dehydrogenase family)
MPRVLVTGASKGIGRAAVRELAARGHDVVATARSLAALEDLPAAARLALDVTDQESVDAAFAAAGELDALISNAGETLRAPAESVPLTEVSRLFQLNTVGALRVAQAVLPGMRARGRGRLLFVSSITGRVVVPLGGAYAASKWALEALAEAIAIEAGHFGVKVTLLEPGAVSSGGSERAATLLSDDDPYLPLARQLAAARGDPITVEEVAQAVADTLEDPDPPLRLPVGRPAATLLAARHATPDDVPFRIAPLRW